MCRRPHIPSSSMLHNLICIEQWHQSLSRVWAAWSFWIFKMLLSFYLFFFLFFWSLRLLCSAQCSPARVLTALMAVLPKLLCQFQQNRTGKKSKYRRYQLIFNANIGGLKENFRRFINFEGQLRRFPDFWNLISTQIFSLKTVFSTFLPQKRALVANHFSQRKYRRFGPKRASYIRDIGAFFESLWEI